MTNRPLSPHLQVYRLPTTAVLSITHRICGVLLALGMLLFIGLLVSMAQGETAYLQMQTLMEFWAGKLLYHGLMLALIFHICHGIRHLLWDLGTSFNRNKLERYALFEMMAFILLSGLFFWIA